MWLGNCPKFKPNIQSCPFWPKIGAHVILEVLILDRDLDFWNSDPKDHFREYLGWKSQSYPFCRKTGTHGISRMLILLIPTLVFWISNRKSIFGQVCAEKLKAVPFAWNLEVLIPNPDLNVWNSDAKTHFGLKKSKLSVLPDNWHTWYLERDDSESEVRFLKFLHQNPFLGRFASKKQSLFILIWDLTHRPEHTVSFGFLF